MPLLSSTLLYCRGVYIGIKIIILVALSSFFASIIVANTEVLHSALIWKAAICCILIAVLGIGIAVIVQKFLDRRK